MEVTKFKTHTLESRKDDWIRKMGIWLKSSETKREKSSKELIRLREKLETANNLLIDSTLFHCLGITQGLAMKEHQKGTVLEIDEYKKKVVEHLEDAV